MIQYFLDTNIIIRHLAGRAKLKFLPKTAAISVLTVFELLRLPGLSNEEEKAIRDIVLECSVIPITESIAERAALFGRTTKKHQIDLLIASSAIELGAPLITQNNRDFKNIPHLRIRESV